MSDEYRKDRFAAVMEQFGIQPAEAFVNKLATTYKSGLETSLELKPGAIELIRYLKDIGKKIMVITEGPQDAQEWTIEMLGLRSEIDFLATTNDFGVSKVDGLFGKVLEKLVVEAADMVYVGDSLERDVVPAREAGIFAVHYEGKGRVVLDVKGMKINTLWKIGAYFERK